MKAVKQIKIFPETKPSLKILKKQIDELAVDPVAKLGLRIAFVTLGLSLVGLTAVWHRLPPEVPLFYSRPYGESQLTGNWSLWFLPLISLTIMVLSLRAAARTRLEEPLLSQILIWSGTVSAVMAAVTLVKIVILVI